MLEFHCHHCKEEMPGQMVQQGGCHLHCYEDYYYAVIPAWRISNDEDSYLETNAEGVFEMIQQMDVGTQYTVTRVEIKRCEYEKLEEFQGF
jgi:hypothetical protein